MQSMDRRQDINQRATQVCYSIICVTSALLIGFVITAAAFALLVCKLKEYDHKEGPNIQTVVL